MRFLIPQDLHMGAWHPSVRYLEWQEWSSVWLPPDTVCLRCSLRYTEDGACRSQVVKLNETQTKAAHWRGWMGGNNALLWGFNDLGRE